jgi:hypothetical protein
LQREYIVRKSSHKPQLLPTDLPARIALVGTTLYGKSWRRRLAVALGVSRSTLWQWLAGSGKHRDVDGDLIALLDVERDAANEHGAELAALRRRFMSIVRT